MTTKTRKAVTEISLDDVDFSEINGISKETGDAILSFLKDGGVTSFEDLTNVTLSQISAVDGVGKATGKKVLEYISKIGEPKNEEDEKEIESAEEELFEEPERESFLLPQNSLKRLDFENDSDIKLMSKAEEMYDLFHKKGIHDLDDLLLYSVDDLAEKIDGVGDKKAELILRKAEEIAGQKSFVQLSEVSANTDCIWTGSIAIDNLLGGGVYTNDSYELYGGYGGGKTQICASLSCRIQLPVDQGGLYVVGQPRPEVLWIDTEDTLRQMKRDQIIKKKAKKVAQKKGKTVDQVLSEIVLKKKKGRLIQISENLGLNFEEEVDPYITHLPCITVADQMRKIEDALGYSNEHNWRLIILDSITKLIRAERTADESYHMKVSRNINNMISNLHRLKAKCNAALVCTNQIYDKSSGYGGARYNEISYGGSAVKHNINNRVHLYETSKGRQAELKDSSYLSGVDPLTGEEGPVTFVINDYGIGDP